MEVSPARAAVACLSAVVVDEVEAAYASVVHVFGAACLVWYVVGAGIVVCGVGCGVWWVFDLVVLEWAWGWCVGPVGVVVGLGRLRDLRREGHVLRRWCSCWCVYGVSVLWSGDVVNVWQRS